LSLHSSFRPSPRSSVPVPTVNGRDLVVTPAEMGEHGFQFGELLEQPPSVSPDIQGCNMTSRPTAVRLGLRPVAARCRGSGRDGSAWQVPLLGLTLPRTALNVHLFDGERQSKSLLLPVS
jgi:hypothetical protein